MFEFLVSKTKRQQRIDRLAKESLKAKLELMVQDIKYCGIIPDVLVPTSLALIVGFFNYMDKKLAELTKEELAVAPEELKNVISTCGRDPYGWFRAEEGKEATNDNTFIQPTGHMDECFRTLTVSKLLTMNNNPSDQGGFARQPMTTCDFYNCTFVRPFIMDKYEALEDAIKKL